MKRLNRLQGRQTERVAASLLQRNSDMETLVLATTMTLSGLLAIASTRALLGMMMRAMSRGTSSR